MKTSKSSGFSALSQSLAILGGDVRSGDALVTKPKKKNHKKKNNKPKTTAEPDGFQIPATYEAVVEDSGDWIPVVSKKSKLKENGLLDGASHSASNNNLQKQNSLPKAQKMPVLSSSASKKKKRNHDPKKTEQSQGPETNVNRVSKEDGVTSSNADPVKQSQPVQQQSSKPKASVPVKTLADPSPSLASAPLSSTNPQLTQQQVLEKTESEARAPNLSEVICSYARQLEYMLAEKIGSESIVKARSSYPCLKFSLPPPSVSSATIESSPVSSESDVISKTEMAFLKADLLAKESEVKVLMETLKRFQDQNSVPAQPLVVVEEKKPEPEKSAKKLKIASKHVQCDISAVPEAQPVVDQQQEQNSTPLLPPPTSPVPSANELTFIKSLQDEIASLSKENAILTQRCNNANSRLEAGNQKYSKLQSETKKMTAKAAKEAEARVRQETEALVKKLQDEVAEKAAQVVTKSSQIESLEKELADSQSKVDQLINSEQTSAARLAECEKTMSDLKVQNDKLTKEKEAFGKNAERINFLNQSLAEKEAEVAKIQGECNRLKNDLEKSNSELDAFKQAVAASTASESALKAAEVEKGEALAEVERLKEECSLLKADLEKSYSELAASKQVVTDLMASESVLKAAEAEKDEALAEVKRLKGELSALRKEFSAKLSELVDVKEAQANVELESASIEAEVAKAFEQRKCSDGNGGFEASESACFHCVELTEELTYLRSTLSKADQDLRKLQKSLDCEETSGVENGDINGCLENGGYNQEADH